MARYDDVRAQVADAARELAAAGLLVGTAGNLSVTVAGTELRAITATGSVLGRCTPDEVSVVDPAGTVVAGQLAPTSELGLHLALAEHPAVVHTHAPYATALACVLDELPVLHYQQLALGGAVRVAPYATFGTPELAAATATALEGRSAVLLANHGSVTVGSTLAKAVEHALLLEWLCALHHRASALGTPRVLDDAAQLAVVEQAIALDYGRTRAADPTGGDA
jgi:L-fuculose-phosphate aldolase